MIKVLMVCLGNICRSPLAEGILRSKVDSDKIFLDSAGTGAWHVGHLPDKRSIEVAKRNGIDITYQRARQFSEDDFDSFDLIYVMDKENLKAVQSMALTKEQRDKVHLILDVVKGTKYREVPDPYYGGEQGFDFVFQLLNEACDQIANNLLNEK
ncbi:low molecular weight protein-tyrosine-phosphatase [Namhaeicola litoreus]|uniref:protein-tyrosine-phosphatase n=1 Tax=Namhaeicola litoreus TaxID=1052145 RepID=A0ABW3Y2B0_9FLAO